MNRLSLKRKLSFLSGFLIFVLIIEGVGGYIHIGRVTQDLNNIVDVQLPAVRHMTLADMYHDVLRSIAFRSLFYSNSQNQELKKEIAKEYKEAAEKIVDEVKGIEKLSIHMETKEMINASLPEIENYVKKVEEVVALSLAGRKDLAEKKVDDMQKGYKNLEAKFDNLASLIEKDAEEGAVEGRNTAESARVISFILLFLGTFVGIGISVWIVGSLVRSLKDLIKHLSISSESVAASSTQIASSSQSLSQATTEQASSLQETAASLEEISSMIAKASDNANSTAKSSSQSQEKAQEGRVAVEQMLNAITEISQSNEAIMGQITESNQQMTEIVRVIQEIGSKTKVINEIVFQTKLLSFNASVEAARAGEHGKGFAVVAEEVGNLAQMSGNAAKEITDMLGQSISKVEQIVSNTKVKVESLIAEGKNKVDTGVSVAKQCSEVFEDIVKNVSEVSSLAQEISQATVEQSQGVAEINKAISQLESVTQSNSTNSEQTASSAKELASQAIQLKNAVEELVLTVNGSLEKNEKHEKLERSVKSNMTMTKGQNKDLESEKKENLESKVLKFGRKSKNIEAVQKNEIPVTHFETGRAVGSELDEVPRSDDEGFNEM